MHAHNSGHLNPYKPPSHNSFSVAFCIIYIWERKLSRRIEGEMMLRSSSTPSLVSSLTKSPAPKQASPPPAAAACKCGRSRVNSPEGAYPTEIRRAQSAGNLEETFSVSFHVDEFTGLSRQSSRRLSRMPTLEAIPSYNDDDDEEEEEEEAAAEGNLNLFTVQNLAGVEAEFNGFCDAGGGKMYLAAGIGLKGMCFLEDGGGFGGGGGGGSYRPVDGFGDGGDNRGLSLENHYKSMLMQDPCNPLLLRNYANFLYQVKGDLVGAEEYYSRAILAEPDDGDILCQYARVIWELHHDKETAQSYFERAVHASSGECNISASYASFLWDLEEGEDDEEGAVKRGPFPKRDPHLGVAHRIMASATA